MLRRNSLTAVMVEAGPGSAIQSTSAGEPPAPTKAGGVDSELSSLSEFGSELTEDSGKQKSIRRRGRGRKTSAATSIVGSLKKYEREDFAGVLLNEGEKLEGGTLGAWLAPWFRFSS